MATSCIAENTGNRIAPCEICVRNLLHASLLKHLSCFSLQLHSCNLNLKDINNVKTVTTCSILMNSSERSGNSVSAAETLWLQFELSLPRHSWSRALICWTLQCLGDCNQPVSLIKFLLDDGHGKNARKREGERRRRKERCQLLPPCASLSLS